MPPAYTLTGCLVAVRCWTNMSPRVRNAMERLGRAAQHSAPPALSIEFAAHLLDLRPAPPKLLRPLLSRGSVPRSATIRRHRHPPFNTVLCEAYGMSGGGGRVKNTNCFCAEVKNKTTDVASALATCARSGQRLADKEENLTWIAATVRPHGGSAFRTQQLEHCPQAERACPCLEVDLLVGGPSPHRRSETKVSAPLARNGFGRPLDSPGCVA